MPMSDGGPAEQLRHLLNEIRVRTTVNGRPMTFGAIARRAGVGSAGYVSDVLKGNRVPSARAAVAFAEAMRATAEEVARVAALAGLAQRIRVAKPETVRVARLLKPAPRGFAGRADDLNVLSSLAGVLGRGAAQRTITRVSGLPGVGKTWLVLHWAHRHLAKFPHGQLYADLRGYAENAEPAWAPEVLPRFLRALGVAAGSIPPDADDQAALFREVTRDRRLLVVLDNVAELGQIEPLLPDGPSTVVVTSRDHLRDLLVGWDAGALQLTGLTEAESGELLASGPVAARAAAEPDALTELVRLCGGLPLALSIVRSQAVIQAGWPLSEVAAFYRDAPDLKGIFRSEYDRFAPDVRAAFRLLGLWPGVEVELAGAASLLGRPLAETAELLHLLVSKSLLEQPARDRFRMHDLVLSFATARAEAELPPGERLAARRRLAASLLAGAHAAQQQLSPHRPPITLDDPGPGVVPLWPAGDAMDWFDARYPILSGLQHYAGEQGWHTMVWQLAWSLDDYHYRRGLVAAHERAWRRGLEAAARSGDPGALALARLCLGNVLTRADRRGEAVPLLERARAWFEETKDVAGLALTHRALQFGSVGPQRLYHAERALELFREHGDPVWIAVALNAVGECLAQLGRPGEARRHCREALALHRELGNEPGEAAALDSLGIAAAAAGDRAGAETDYRAAIALYRRLRNQSSEANTLVRLGEVLDPRRARAEWTRAVELLEEQGRSDEADDVRRRL
jgi:tetratricopeptide (TPR) repeat protein